MSPLRGPLRGGSASRNPMGYFVRRLVRKLIFIIIAAIVIAALYFMGYIG